MFIISLVLMTACGGSPVDKALAKLDDAIEKLEKKGDKMTKDEMDAIMKDLEEPVSVLNKTIEDNEVGGVTKIKIIAKVTKLTALATKVGIKNLDSNQKMESGLSVNNSVFVNEEESNAEFISIKKSWLRNIAAACIALIAFFTYSSPLGTPTVQKSQIDTGMLNRIMPKEINKVAQPQELVLSTESQAEESIPAKSVNMTQDNELQTASSYYSIVLASRVTKRNAASYAELLQNKGFKEARVLITDNNVKVIYGTYSTEGEAYTALNRLHNYDAFTDGWITKVKE